MGYVSQTGGGTTTAPRGYVSQTGGAGAPAQEGHSPLGFLGNLIGGVKDVTLGLGKMIVAVPHDIVSGVADIIPGVDSSYMTDDVIKGLAAMPQDYWDRYSPLLPGGRPASQFLEELYQKPVSFGLDALAVASAAGGAARAAGSAKLAKAGGEAALVSEGVTDALLAQAKTGLRTSRAAGVRAGLEMLPEVPGYSHLLPSVRQVRSGTSAVATTTLRNPLLRVGQNVLETKLGPRLSVMEPIEVFKANIDARAARLGGTPETTNAYKIRENGIYDRAKAAGVQYIDRSPVYTRRASTTTGALQRFSSGAWFRDRGKDQQAIRDIVTPALDQMDEKALTASNLRSMDGHLLLDTTDINSEIATRVIREAGGLEDEGGYAKTISLVTEPPAYASGTMFHGTKGAVSSVDDLSPLGYGDPQALAGPGLYLTDDPAIARGYARTKGVGPEGNVFPATVSSDVRFLNLDEMLPDDVADSIREWVRANEGTIGFDDAYDNYRGITGHQAIEKLKQSFADAGVTRGDAGEMFTDLQYRLEQTFGLGGFEYRGGLRRGNVEHNVKVLWETDEGALAGKVAPVPAALPTGPTALPLLRDLTPETVARLQDTFPDYHPEEALRIVQDHIDTTLKDPNVGVMGWSPEKLAWELDGAQRTKDWLIREAERIASGEADAQFVMDARLRVKDIIDHADEFKTLQESPAMMLERAYRPMRAINGIDDAISAAQLDDAVRAAGETAPGYYPMVDINRVGPGDWAMRNPASNAAMKAAKDPHLKYNEQILLHRGTYIRDPLQARLIRAARHTKADATLRYIEGVLNSRVGRRLQPGEHLAPDEMVIPIEWTRGINQFTKEFYDNRLRYMAEGLDDGDATLRAMTDSMIKAQDRIASGELDAAKETMYAVPKKVANQLNASARAAGIVNGPAAKIYVQGPMNVWRSMVLAGSPRWVVNNVLGNSVMTIMQGAPVTRAFHILEQRYKEILREKYPKVFGNLKTGYLDEIRQRLDESSILDEVETTYAGVEAGMQTHIPGAEAVAGPGGKWLVNARTLRARAQGLTRGERRSTLSRGERALNRAQRIGDATRAFNGNVETAFRMNSALTAAERLAGIGHMKRMAGRFASTYERMNTIFGEKGLSQTAARATVKEMNFFLGDYGSLGPWERGLIRPYIFPFWGFYKHVGKLLLSYPFVYPERAVVLGALANATQDMMDAYGPLPGWMDAAMPLAPPGTGDQPFLMTAGPNPFSGLFQSPLGQLSPLFKIPIEHFTGRNLFTGQVFTDKDTVTPFGTEQQFRIVRDENGKPVDAVPVEKVTPSIWEAMLSQIPQYELIKDTLAGGKTFDTSGIVDVMQGEGLITDPETGEAKYPLGVAQAVAKFAGFSQIPFDYSAYQSWLGEQRQAALTEALNREGF